MDLDAIEKRANAATPGHWGSHRDLGGTYTVQAQPRTTPTGTENGGDIAAFAADRPEAESYANSRFVAHARQDVPALVGRVRELENAAPSDEGTRADILRWAAHHLRQTPIDATALTGPVWYGAGWKDATDHLELLADGEARTPDNHDERSPLYERFAAAALTVPIRLSPATIRNAQAGKNVTRLSGAEADHVAQVVMDVLANRIGTPAGVDYDPRTEVEAHWGGDPERLIAAWEDDRATQQARFLQLVANEPGIPGYAHESLARALRGEEA